jgi:hypothetical protein
MTTATIEAETEVRPASRRATTHKPIPMSRIVGIELRKMFNTRSGFWLLASIGIAAVLASVATLLWAPDSELTYDSFAAAIGVPITIILPMVGVLAVTSEWSQRTGLTTFTLVPHRGRVITAKLIATLMVGALSMAVAFAVGALGNIAGSAIAGVDTVWDISLDRALLIVLADGLGMLMGFMLGVLIRNSPGAIVGYFVYALVLPAIFGALAAFQQWFADLQGWVDFQYASGRLYDGGLDSTDWAHLATAGGLWLALPLAIGLWVVLRSEVK